MPNEFQIPVFLDWHARMLRLCGRLETDDAAKLGLVEAMGKTRFTFTAGEGDDAQYFVLFGGSTENGDRKHVHLDIVAARHLPPPPKNFVVDEARLRQTWASFLGERVSVAVTGRFACKLEDVPETSFVKSVRLTAKRGDLELEQTGADFTVKTPAGSVEGFGWHVADNGTELWFEVEFTVTETIDPTYATRLYARANSLFRSLTFNEVTNATDK